MTKQSRILPEYNLGFEIVSQIPWLQEALLAWFHSQGRSFPWRQRGRTAYEILVAEILLQRTTAAKVAKTYDAFLERYPSWNSLADTSLEDLQSFLKPLGLWLQKALVFQSLSRVIEKQSGFVPTSRSELEKLPGVGQYIANAVLLTLNKQPEPLLDVNMARVLERFFGPRNLADIRYDPYLQTLGRRVVDIEKSLQVNWAILDLGAVICKNGTPLCQQCPLKTNCRFYLQKTPSSQANLLVSHVAGSLITCECVSGKASYTTGTSISSGANTPSSTASETPLANTSSLEE